MTAVPEPFDYDEWLASVEGKTVTLDAPDGFPEVAACYYLPPWFGVRMDYCRKCDDWRCMVSESWEPSDAVGHCPVCGNEPGMLELGTDPADGWEPEVSVFEVAEVRPEDGDSA